MPKGTVFTAKVIKEPEILENGNWKLEVEFIDNMQQVDAESIEFSPLSGAVDIKEPEEIDETLIEEEMEEFRTYMKKKNETPEI